MNSLSELKKLLDKGTDRTYIATVQSIEGDKVRVLLGNSSAVVWGTAKVGDAVMIANSQIVAIINRERVQVVHVP